MISPKKLSLDPILHKQIVILGYGSQGRAQALNLRDSGCNVRVGLRRGSPSFRLAKQDGILAMDMDKAVRDADVICFLVPDECHREVYEKYVRSHLVKQTLIFAHGFSLVYQQIDPPECVNVGLIAPKVPGITLRDTYLSGQGLPIQVAVHQNNKTTLPIVLAYAKAIGLGKKSVLETTFRDETFGDLFGEQAILCGGMIEFVKAAFDVAVQEGLSPDAAYYECLHKLKYVVELFEQHGLEGMGHKISHTAHYGGMTRGKRLITGSVKRELRTIFREIQSGQFAKEWLEENRRGLKIYRKLADEQSGHLIEKTGKRLRQLLR